MAAAVGAMRARATGTAWPAVTAMLLLFALTFPAMKAATTGLGVGTATSLRFVIASAVLLPLCWRQLGHVGPVWRKLVFAGVVGLGAQALFMVAGVDAGSASLAALILGLEPIGIAVCAALVGGEHLDRRTVGALALGFAGVAVVSGALSEPLGDIPADAVGFLLLTVVTFSGYTVAIRRFRGQADPLVIATVTTLGGMLVTAPLLVLDVARGQAVEDVASLSTVVGVTYMGVGAAFGYVLFAHILATRASSSLAVVLYLLPPLGVLASWALLGEEPHARDAVGAVFILSAVALAERGRRRAATAAEVTPT